MKRKKTKSRFPTSLYESIHQIPVMAFDRVPAYAFFNFFVFRNGVKITIEAQPERLGKAARDLLNGQ